MPTPQLSRFALIGWLLLFSCLGIGTAYPAKSDNREVRIGVLAFQGAERTLKRWIPTAQYLTDGIDAHRFEIVPLNLDELANAVAEQKVDFALTNPGHYVTLEALHGASRIVTLRNVRDGQTYTQYGSVIVTRQDSTEIQRIEDLKGRSFMAISEQAFGGFQMAWLEFHRRNINPFSDLSELRFSGFPQSQVVFAVLRGEIDAGTVRAETLNRMIGEGVIHAGELRILNETNHDSYPLPHSTALYPEWAFAKLKHTPDDLAEEVAVLLLTLSSESDASRAASIHGWTIPLDYSRVHDLFRTLQIGPYAYLGRVSLGSVVRQYGYWIALVGVLLIALALATALTIRVNRHLARSEQEVAKQRDLLEVRVRDRTQELERVNLELNEDIQARQRVERRLRASESILRRLYDITADTGMPLPEKIQTLLHAGCDFFQLEMGLLARIDNARPAIAYQHPESLPLEDDEMDAVLAALLARSAAELTLEIQDTHSTEEENLIPVRELGVGSALGSTVTVSATEYGLLCFLDRSPRTESFDAVDQEILHLVAQWIGGAVERQQSAAEAQRHRAELAHVSRLGTMGEMASGMAHELNQPLTAIINYIQGCIRRLEHRSPTSDGSVAEALSNAVAEAERAAAIIRQLREFVRKSEPRRSAVDVNQAIRQSVTFTQADASNRGIRIDLCLAEDLPPVEGDLIQLEQVILNLLRNSVDALQNVKHEGRIHITSRLDKSSNVVVTVDDNGVGIESGQREKLFHPFFTTKEKGLGLGLSISRSIVEALGGRLIAESPESGGLSITITIPTLSNRAHVA